MIESRDQNDQTVLLIGETGMGKTRSLKNLPANKTVYANADAGKRLPFQNKFRKEFIITDPMQFINIMNKIESKDDIDILVADTINNLMDLFVTRYIKNSPDTRKAWGDYSQFINDLFGQYLPNTKKTYIFLGHLETQEDNFGVQRQVVPIQGKLGKGKGIESFFSTIIRATIVDVDDLEPYQNPNLIITPNEKEDGFKYVFQTRKTKHSRSFNIRSPEDMWSRQETYIDNDMNIVIERLKQYYN